MKLVHLSYSMNGGAGLCARRLHETLLRLGLDSKLIVARGYSDKNRFIDVLSPRRNPRWSTLGRRLLGRRSRLSACSREFRKINSLAIGGSAPVETFSFPYSSYSPEEHPWLQEDAVPVIHWVGGLLDWQRFFRINRKAVVFYLHDEQPFLGGFHYSGQRDHNPAFAKLEQSLKAAKRKALSNQRCIVLGVSEWLTEKARSSGFFPDSTHFQTTRCAFPTDQFKPIEKIAAKTSLGIPLHHTVIGYAAEKTTNPRKGLDDLLHTLSSITEKSSKPLHLLTFGEASNRTSWPAIPSLHLGILQSPTLQSLCYSAMDICVVPSKEEAFGLVAAEAQLCKTSVIASKAGGLPEAIENGKGGLLFEPGNREELKKCLLHFLDHPELVEEKAMTGYEAAQRRHNSEAIVEEFRNLEARIRSM